MSCSSQDISNIPKEINSLENLTAYPVDRHADTVYFEQEQLFGNTENVLVGSMGQVAVDREGKVYVADNKQKCIHAFNPGGDYLAQIGKEGRGPGEFSYISGIKIISNKLIAVDGSQFKANIFPLDPLRFSGVRKLHPTNKNQIKELEGTQASQYVIRDSNSFWVSFKFPRRMSSADQKKSVPYYLMNAQRVLQPDKKLELKDLIFLTTTINGNPRAANFSFTPRSILTLSKDDHIFTNWSEDFLIKVYNPEGEYLRAFYYSYDKVPLVEDQLIVNYSHEMHRKMIIEAVLPPTWPALAQMLIDDQNRLWVATIVADQDVYQWWVLDAGDGHVIARFTWPRAESIEVVKGGKLYTRETAEETGLQQIVRYDITMTEQ